MQVVLRTPYSAGCRWVDRCGETDRRVSKFGASVQGCVTSSCFPSCTMPPRTPDAARDDCQLTDLTCGACRLPCFSSAGGCTFVWAASLWLEMWALDKRSEAARRTSIICFRLSVVDLRATTYRYLPAQCQCDLPEADQIGRLPACDPDL